MSRTLGRDAEDAITVQSRVLRAQRAKKVTLHREMGQGGIPMQGNPTHIKISRASARRLFKIAHRDEKPPLVLQHRLTGPN